MQRLASVTIGQMILHFGTIPPRERGPNVARQMGTSPVAARRLGYGDVLLQVHLAQPLACPVGERRHPVWSQPQQRGDLCRALALDLGVPKHGSPALRKASESPCRISPFEGLHGRI